MSDRRDDLRKEIEDADDTGLVAGEELIANLHAALPQGHPGHAAIDQLHGEVKSGRPDRHAIQGHVGRLRAIPELEAIVANWWDDPKTQRVIAGIGQIGL